MGMVGRRYRYRINAFGFLVKHFAEIYITLCLRKFFDSSCSLPVIYVAQVSYVSFAACIKMADIIKAFTTHTNGCNIQLIAWCNKTFSQHMAGHYLQASQCSSAVADKIAAGMVCFLLFLVVLH